MSLLALVSLVSAAAADTPQLIDDRAITIHSARDVTAMRRALIQYLWGADGFPSRRLPDRVLTNVSSPVNHLSWLARVDELHVEQRVGATLDRIGRGTFRLVIDEVAPSHMISHHALNDIILPELRQADARDESSPARRVAGHGSGVQLGNRRRSGFRTASRPHWRTPPVESW